MGIASSGEGAVEFEGGQGLAEWLPGSVLLFIVLSRTICWTEKYRPVLNRTTIFLKSLNKKSPPLQRGA